MKWSAKLSRPVALRDGTTLKTLADVRAFILDQPEHAQDRRAWQRATKLLMAAAETGAGIEAATRQVELALFVEGRLVLQGRDTTR
jgi:ABC-type taurine transport system ATPase subunit